jgi:hypothetical protein
VKLVFIDAEYTGEHAYTTLVSLGLVTLDGRELQINLHDYAQDQVTDWLRENVLAHIDPATCVDSPEAYRRLSSWIDAYAGGDRVHLVSAGLGSDLLLLFELYRFAQPERTHFHALHCLPASLNHAQHLDLNTLFLAAGHDPDGDRDEFVGNAVTGRRHDALHDARLARECFLKLLAAPELVRFRAATAGEAP